MKLTLDLPTTRAELARFLEGAQLLGLDVVEAMDQLQLQARLSDAAAAATPQPDPPPSAPTPPAAATPEPTRAKRTRSTSGSKTTSPKTSKAPSSTAGPRGELVTKILTAIADQGGTWEGSAKDLAASIEGAARDTAQKAISRLAANGLLALTKPHPRKVTEVCLTKDGWAALGRTPVGGPLHEIDLSGDATKTPDVEAPPIDAGPMARNGFDPDRARQAAAAAL